MNLFYFFYKFRHKFNTVYRKIIFKKLTGCKHDDFLIVGDITLINTNIEIGRGVTIYPGAMFWGDGEIKIGNNVDIGKDTIIYSSKKGGVYIDDDTQIAAQCYIIDMDHGMKKGTLIRKQPNNTEKIIIGKDVWVAANCTILKGSQINDGAVIGAKSLVKGNVQENAIMIGIPAKKMKYRQR